MKKIYENRIHEIKKIREEIGEKVTNLQIESTKLNKELKELQLKLWNLDHNEFEVSDHAVLRWLERKDKLDVEALRQKILDEIKEATGEQPSHGDFKVKDYVVRISNHTVQTIFDANDVKIIIKKKKKK